MESNPFMAGIEVSAEFFMWPDESFYRGQLFLRGSCGFFMRLSSGRVFYLSFLSVRCFYMRILIFCVCTAFIAYILK